MPPAQSDNERRSHRRVAARLTVHCRRVGRSGVDDDVEIIDLSMGGVRITAPERLDVGDTVELSVLEADEALTLSGLVVSTRTSGDDGRYGHIAFTRLGPTTLERIGHLIDVHENA